MAPFTVRLSRNLWQEVTHYLRLGDIDAATEQKRRLEEKQRTEERKRETLRTPWRPKYFIPEVSLACYQALALRSPQLLLLRQLDRQDIQALGRAGQSVALAQVGGWDLGLSFPSNILASHTILRAEVCS